MIKLSSTQLLGVFFFILLLALISVGFRFPSFLWSWLGGAWLTTNFLLSIGIVTLLILGIGYAINGQMFGILIDHRNKMSLSRFQLVIWSLLVICSLWTAFSWNISESIAHSPGDLKVPTQLFVVMGLASFTGLASPILLNQKRSQSPDMAQFADQLATIQKSGTATRSYKNDGSVVLRASASDASWADIFRGDETGNVGSPDIGKLQNFMFTIVLVATYAGALFTQFAGTQPGSLAPDFPPFSDTMTIFLAISHATYLSAKILPVSSSAGS
jgi:hypothetical protein